VIVGGGVAGLEALLGLRDLLGDRVALTVVSKGDALVDRPMTVAEPFGFGSAARHSLPDIAAGVGAEFVQAAIAAVDAAGHLVTCADGHEIGFDTLILAPGARLSSSVPDAITFGMEGSGEAMGELLSRMHGGQVHRVAFVAPSMTGWLVPLYELALMTARNRSLNKLKGVHLSFVTSETRPLALFGEQASRGVARLLDAAGIEFVGAVAGTHEVIVRASSEPRTDDCLVTLPLLRGPGIGGLPATPGEGFIPVDEYGRVEGLTDVYGAGDAVNFPVKQGGLAAQMADSVIESVAAKHGAAIDPSPFRPVLRGMLFTGGEPRFMRSGVPGAESEAIAAWHPLWWPPTKVAGRYLSPYLFGRTGDVFERHPGGFVDVDIPLTAATLPA
jgi:sulfide:quinone oxidoreductase